MLLVLSKSKELIGRLKMNQTVRSLAFADDSKQLPIWAGLSLGSENEDLLA